MNSGKIEFINFIQVAGVIDQEEVDLLVNAGVNFLGFPLRLPVNKEDLTEDDAAKIISKLQPPVHGIVISYSSTAKEAIELCQKLNSNIIQLHGPIEIGQLEKIKAVKPAIAIIKSLVISENNSGDLINTIVKMEKYVDAFITDTYDSKTGASGATGKTHDWSISKMLVELSKKPVILAGGINHDNVYEAIKFVKPAGVDVHTGVENALGRKDEQLVQKFITQAKKAFREVENEKL
jgi:phosphoribosylanthranilate isomerase